MVCVCPHTHTDTHTMEYSSAIRRNQILPFATTWMELEGIILNEVCQTAKDKYGLIFLYVGSKKQNKIKVRDVDNRLVVVREG